jgi:hypothetical protein
MTACLNRLRNRDWDGMKMDEIGEKYPDVVDPWGKVTIVTIVVPPQYTSRIDCGQKKSCFCA